MLKKISLVLMLVAISQGSVFAQNSVPQTPLTIPTQAPAGEGAQDLPPDVAQMGLIWAEMTPSKLAVAPGDTVIIAIRTNMADTYAWYSPDARLKVKGEISPEANAQLIVKAGDLKVGKIRWPMDKRKKVYDVGEVFAYKHNPVIFVPIMIPANAKPGLVKIGINLGGQMCSDAQDGGCIAINPDDKQNQFMTSIKVADKSVANPQWAKLAPKYAASFTVAQLKEMHDKIEKMNDMTRKVSVAMDSEIGFATAIGLALLSGLILNIMPCVLPVIPIRILSLVDMAAGSRRRFITMGLAFVLGMMLFFGGVAGVNVGLKLASSTSRGLSISEVLQDPLVVVIMTVVLVAVAANLFGIFNVIVPTKVAGLESKVQSGQSGHLKSIGMGFMMAILATPCSFGFLVTALGFAQVAPLYQGTLVILLVGVGMSFPHFILAVFPSLIDKLPKPGAWMEYFKHTCGFLILLVAIFIISYLRGDSYKDSYPFWVIGWCVILTMGLWIWANWVKYDAKFSKKLIVRLFAVLLVVGSGYWMLQYPEAPLIKPTAFVEGQIADYNSKGQAVMVKFTSKICTKCIVQEKEIFNTPDVAKAIHKYNVKYMKGDISKGSPAQRWLKRTEGSAMVPVTYIFPANGGSPVMFRADLTKKKLIDALKKASKK